MLLINQKTLKLKNSVKIEANAMKRIKSKINQRETEWKLDNENSSDPIRGQQRKHNER